jgi:hypothetical protein
MKLAIMQPYFFPYIGYFQLMNAVDEFILYDNIEFSKKGWVNRNRILVNGKDVMFTLPLKKDSDFLHIGDRYLADIWSTEKINLLNKIRETYRKAPFFNAAFPIVEQSVLYSENNLFKFILNSLVQVKNYLGIATPLVVSSHIAIDHGLKSEDKVIALCKNRNATVYINPIGGLELYDRSRFKDEGIELHFLEANNIQYTQFGQPFVPFLSMIDVMMFNSAQQIAGFLSQYAIR